MQIKKFIATTLKQATIQMKNELGNEAIIMGSRIIAGANGKRLFELSAGIEDDELVELSKTNEKQNSLIVDKSIHRERTKFLEKSFLNSNIKNNFPGTSSVAKKPLNMKVSVNYDIEKDLKEVVDTLFAKDVQRPIISSILNQLKKHKNYLKPSNIDNYIISSIASLIPISRFEVHKQKKPKVVALVGPTGVGKTTCIAKLAIISKILHNLDVGLISIDTYRLGAIDQLRIFSEISKIDMLVAYEASEIPKLMNSFKRKDIVFIDTAGRSQKNKEHLINANEFLTGAGVDESYLVLSSTGTTKNLIDVAEKFKIFNYKSVIFTKIDEAVTFGNILNILNKFEVPVSFLSNGQVIPDDIVSADPEFIANMIYTGKYN